MGLVFLIVAMLSGSIGFMTAALLSTSKIKYLEERIAILKYEKEKNNE